MRTTAHHKQFLERCTALPNPPLPDCLLPVMTALPRIFLRKAPPPSQTTVFQPPAHLDALLHDHRVDFGLWNKLYAHELITAEIMDNGLAYNEDLVANWQIFSAAGGCAYVDFAGYHYRQHAASASHRALPPESIDQQRQAAVFIREHASPAIQQSANAFYYEKLVYLASMILRAGRCRRLPRADQRAGGGHPRRAAGP